MSAKRHTPLPIRVGLYACMALFAGCMWFIVDHNYQYDALAGDYTYTNQDTRCTVHLHQDHSFEEDLQTGNRTLHAEGTWNLFDESHIHFSGSFLPPAGTQLNESHLADGNFYHLLGLIPRFQLSPERTGPLFKRHWF